MKKLLFVLFLFLNLAAFGSPLWMRYPSISPDGNKIAFTYKGDVFVVNANGGKALQITSNTGIDYMPIWSNDGTKIAFASNRHGNFDVFTVSENGGIPERITFHSSNDYPYTFSPDDKKVIFGSVRLDAKNSVQFPYGLLSELYSVPTNGGRAIQELTIAAENVKYSEDGKTIIFQNKKGYENAWRKHHTSSVARDIVTYNLETKVYTPITKWSGEDRNPIFIDADHFYFLSEKSGSFNIWQGSLSNPYEKQITDFKTHPVRFLSKSKTGALAFGFDGEIYTLKNGKTQKVGIEINKDNIANSIVPKRVNGGASGVSVSPDGKEIAFVHRGEVFVTSVEYATTKRITNTPEQERNVSFSPDGKKLLYAGERNNSWNLYEASIVRDEEKHFYNATLIKEEKLVDNGEETFQAKYSPDGKEVAFLENRTTIRAINLKSKEIRTILGGEYNYSYTDGDQYYTWSPDSKYILAQFFEFDRWITDIGLIAASGKKKPINLTKSGYGQGNAKFAMDGEMVYYSTDKYGNRSHGSWGAHSDIEAIFLTQDAFYKFTLNKEDYSEWKDEQKEKDKSKEEEEEKEDKGKGKGKKNKEKKEDVVVDIDPIKIELEGLFDRKIRLTIHSSDLSDFVINNDATEMHYLAHFEKGHDLWKTDFKEKKTEIVTKLGSWSGQLEFDKKEENLFYTKSGGITKLDVSSGKSKSVAIKSEMNINLSSERTYMFEHSWRQVREKFYVEDLHGVDWDLMKAEYGRFLPHINNGFDFSEMLSEMLGELNASHTGSRFRTSDANGDQTATLACYFDESYTGNGLKIVEIMDKSPLTKDSKKITKGTIIVAIDGINILKGDNYYPLLNRKVGKRVLLSLEDPNGNKWEQIIKPVSLRAENNLAYQRWVKNCEKSVDELSDGKLGYVHIRGMNSNSFRELFDKALGQLHEKDALIIDTRFNGGGWLHDDLATFLSGKMYMEFVPRGQNNMGGEPIWKWQKPSCVLMSEGNYSDAHLFPYTYKALGIGKLIGMPVPGTGTAVWWETMIDGKTVFGIPQIGMRSVAEGYLVENHELKPDIQINNEYSKFINGEDQQLGAAVKEMLK